MKRYTLILFAIVSLTLSGCMDDECDELCFTPPDTFVFELVDSQNGENLFTNGTFSRSEIKVKNVGTGSSEGFTFIDEDDVNLIVFHTIGWETEIVELALTLGDLDVFSIYVDSERMNQNCCSFTEYNEIRLENANYEYIPDTNIYRIFIDLN